MTPRERAQTINECISLVFMVAFVLEERYHWRDKLVERTKELRKQRQERYRAERTERFEVWSTNLRRAEVAQLEDVWARP